MRRTNSLEKTLILGKIEHPHTQYEQQWVRLCCDRRQPTRLLRPWDSPGKNTGVGCHFLRQCMKVKSESEVAQSCPTLYDPMECSLSGSSVHGVFQARVLEWGAIAFSVLSLREVDSLTNPASPVGGEQAGSQLQAMGLPRVGHD